MAILTNKSKNLLRGELGRVLNTAALANLDRQFHLWVEEAEDAIECGRTDMEVRSLYTNDGRPHLIDVSDCARPST